MTVRRTPPHFLRRAVWAVAAACALGNTALAADPTPSRAYPPTYSSRKAPWYDPFRVFTDQKKTGTIIPASQTQSKPVPTTQVETATAAAGSPAWKWYGYGTPLPGGSPLAPAAGSAAVPGNWYTASGATPGAVPTARIGGAPGLVPDPAPGPRVIHQESTFASTPDGPDHPPVVSPPSAELAADANWAPATLRPPSQDRIAASLDPATPPARLKPPVQEDEGIGSSPTLGVPVPAPAAVPPAESPDLPVVPAPGVVAPPLKGGVSSAARPLTARGRAPELDPADVIRRACGTDVRVMEIAPAGPQRVVLRVAGRADAIRSAVDHLSRTTELAGWRIDVELVTALRP